MPDHSPTIPPLCERLLRLADRDPRRTVPLARRALDRTPDDGGALWAWAAFTLGWALLSWERFDEARTHLQDAEARFVALHDRYGALRCHHGLLLAEQIQYTHLNTAEALGLVADKLIACGDYPRACHARLYQGIALNMRGQSTEADNIFASIEGNLLPNDELNRGRLLRIRGATAIGHGEYDNAVRLLAQAEQSAVYQKNDLEIARIWFESGWLALRQERIDTAFELYLRANTVFVKYGMTLRIAFCAKAIGWIQSRSGEYDLAVDSIFMALKHFRILGRTRDIAACQLNLGNIYFYTGRWEAALACYILAEQLYTTVEVMDEVLYAKRNRAAIYRAQERYEEALTLLVDVEQQAGLIGNKAELAEIYSLRAAILADTANLEQALDIFEHTYTLFIDMGNKTAAAECLLQSGWVFLRYQDIQSAYEMFQQAASDLRQHPHHYWRVVYGLARCAAAQGDVEAALAHYGEAGLLVAGLRRRLASEEISSSLYDQAKELYHDGLSLAAEAGDVATVLLLSESQRALVLQRMLVERLPSPQEALGEEHQALRQRIGALMPASGQPDDPEALDAALVEYGDLLMRARHSPALAGRPLAALPTMMFDLHDVRAILEQDYGSDWTALSYTFAGERLLITMITADSLYQAETPVDATLYRLIEHATHTKHRHRIYLDLAFLMKPAAGRWKALSDLALRLLPPVVRARLNPAHRLFVVPAGPLHGLPWAALRLDDAWLVEQAVIHVVPSLTVVQLLAARPASTQPAALLLGCGDFGVRADPLPGVQSELMALSDLHGPRADLVYPAPRAALLDRSVSGELSRYGRIHIASHGKLLGQRGLAAHLKLADEDLLLPEVAALRLDGQLVALSACDGAAADVLPGDEVFSLSRAFLAAGASAVLASQWPVYDLAVIQFMTDFYTALDQHEDPALALALTQRAHMHAFPDPEDHRGLPFCWGCFVLVGGLLPNVDRRT